MPRRLRRLREHDGDVKAPSPLPRSRGESPSFPKKFSRNLVDSKTIGTFRYVNGLQGCTSYGESSANAIMVNCELSRQQMWAWGDYLPASGGGGGGGRGGGGH